MSPWFSGAGRRAGRRLPGAALGFKVALLLVLAVLGGCGGAGQEDGAAVLRATLHNGLRVVIVPNRLAPVATLVVNYLVGSNEAPPGFPGMAHAQEHMMFRGSPGLSANQLANVIAALGGVFDADTQQALTQYFMTVPAPDLEVALRIEAIRMRGVLDSDRLWAQERGAIEQEVAQDLSDPEFVFYTDLLASMFKGTPYAQAPLGTKGSFDRTTGAMLKKFYDTWYAPNNAIMVIAGNVEPRKTLAKVKRLFGAIAAKKLPPRPPFRLEPVTSERLALTSDLPVGLVFVSFRLPGFDSPDYAASQVLADVLSSQRGDLYGLVVAGKALAASFSLNTLPRAGLGYAVAAFPKGGDPERLLAEVKDVLARVGKDWVSADLVAAAKKLRRTRAEYRKNSVSGLALAWSRALALEGRQSPEDDLKAIDRVSSADVDRVARSCLDLDKAVLAVLTPEPSGKPVSSRGFGGLEAVPLKPTENVTLPGWAAKALSRLAVPASTVQPVVSLLPNGIKLIVVPESVSNTVSVYGQVKNQPDLQVPRGQEGVDQVLDQLFSYGTTSLDRLAFQKAADEIGAQVSAGASFSLEVLTEHFQRGVQLLADNELHPALPGEAFAIVRSQVAAAVAGQLQSPEYLEGRALEGALFPPADPTLRRPTPESVSKLTLQQVKDYFGQVFRPDMTTVVVIGKVKPDQAREVIESCLGSWRAAGPKPDTLLPPVPPSGPSTAFVPDRSRIQDKVVLAETLGLTRAHPDYYALTLGNQVLGGGFYASRLYRDLRERTGLVYHVGVDLNANQTRAIYAVDYACMPDNVAKARAIAVHNLMEMRAQPVKAAELHQAKAMLLRELPLAESSLPSIALGLISRSLLDLPLDEPTLAARRYLEMTPEQVKGAFARWLRPDDLVEVTLGPAPR